MEKRKIALKVLCCIAACVALVATCSVCCAAEDVTYCTKMDYSQCSVTVNNVTVNLSTSYTGPAMTETRYYTGSEWNITVNYSDGLLYYYINLSTTSTFNGEYHAKFNACMTNSDDDDRFGPFNSAGSIEGTDQYTGFSWSKYVDPNDAVSQGWSLNSNVYSGTLVGARDYGVTRGKQYSVSNTTTSGTSSRQSVYAFFGVVDRYFELSPSTNKWVVRLRVETPQQHVQRLAGVKAFTYYAQGTYPTNAQVNTFKGFGDFMSSTLSGFLNFQIMPFVTFFGILSTVIAICGFFVLLRLWGGHG